MFWIIFKALFLFPIPGLMPHIAFHYNSSWFFPGLMLYTLQISSSSGSSIGFAYASDSFIRLYKLYHKSPEASIQIFKCPRAYRSSRPPGQCINLLISYRFSSIMILANIHYLFYHSRERSVPSHGSFDCRMR